MIIDAASLIGLVFSSTVLGGFIANAIGKAGAAGLKTVEGKLPPEFTPLINAEVEKALAYAKANEASLEQKYHVPDAVATLVNRSFDSLDKSVAALQASQPAVVNPPATPVPPVEPTPTVDLPPSDPVIDTGQTGPAGNLPILTGPAV